MGERKKEREKERDIVKETEKKEKSVDSSLSRQMSPWKFFSCGRRIFEEAVETRRVNRTVSGPK